MMMELKLKPKKLSLLFFDSLIELKFMFQGQWGKKFIHKFPRENKASDL